MQTYVQGILKSCMPAHKLIFSHCCRLFCSHVAFTADAAVAAAAAAAHKKSNEKR